MNYFIFLLLFAISHPAQNIRVNMHSDPVDSLLAEIADEDEPGCAVSVFQNGEQILYKARGIANMDYGIPISEDSRFYMASLSKQVTATAAIHLLLDEGIPLTDHVSNHIDMPEIFGDITFDHLLSNTSGVPDLYSMLRISNISLSDVLTTEEYAHIVLASESLAHEPGEKYAYTNGGFTLLAHFIEQVSGSSFAEYVQKKVLSPLGMDHSHFHTNRYTVIPNRVVSYTPDENGFRYTYLSNFQGAGPGGLYATHADWIKWDQFLHHNASDDPLLSQIPALLKEPLAESGDQAEYARGLVISTTNGVQMIGHSGSFMGFKNDYRHIPATSESYLLTCNRRDVNATNSNRGFIQIRNEGAFQAHLQQFEGSYLNEELGAVYHLSEKNGRLHLDRKGSSGQYLSESDEMVWSSGSWTFKFQKNGSGEITSFRLDAGRANDILFERISTEMAAAREF